MYSDVDNIFLKFKTNRMNNKTLILPISEKELLDMFEKLGFYDIMPSRCPNAFEPISSDYKEIGVLNDFEKCCLVFEIEQLEEHTRLHKIVNDPYADKNSLAYNKAEQRHQVLHQATNAATALRALSIRLRTEHHSWNDRNSYM